MKGKWEGCQGWREAEDAGDLWSWKGPPGVFSGMTAPPAP